MGLNLFHICIITVTIIGVTTIFTILSFESNYNEDYSKLKCTVLGFEWSDARQLCIEMDQNTCEKFGGKYENFGSELDVYENPTRHDVFFTIRGCNFSK